ncbi:uncharacterized protein TOT_020000492 [Theileria orientalis strain Shintoku]|uniref:HSA domain-containing protein n=1 Tax=Theileria orientalis strain Shintoku TaxID=869250 RepID=J4C3D1_THEOR|nr:uncharacterized protein TOT_020000492 [Theileria orientalis strain Shintoku]BAM40231.1 uncharacterized protein TOT_020000492 [Theileria orientalis strain Shintoku]|eukprot:XP_009690532.1 uncharacterized protein TOT_020000492 [Theileria orientalis strain Shintoku]
MMEKNSKDTQQASEMNAYNISGPSQQNHQKTVNGSEKRKAETSEYDMWKFSYSLVKNGYSILAPEPSQRSRSYRDLILQEMNWMALDYYQERRWKSHIAKEISNSINTSIIDRKKLKRDWPSKQCSYNVEMFWLKLKETGENSGISNALQEYCQRMVSGKNLWFNSHEVVEEAPPKRNDLLAITVPVYKNANTNSVNIAKNEVVNATLNHMLVLGADLYPQYHRPPDDEIDVFTLPALNPKHEFDYNTLLLMLYSLQGNMLKKMSRQELKAILTNVNKYKTYQQQQTAPTQPLRRLPRDDIDPFSLSVNYRDFLDNSPMQPMYVQKMVLKWEDPVINDSDFELLDSWMLEKRCWPLISIALNLRSSSGGLMRRDFSPRACREAFKKIKKTPRGLVNSSKKLLGPKQTKTILSFIDAPPGNYKFKLIVPPESATADPNVKLMTSESGESQMKTLFGEVFRYYREESKLYSMTQAGKKETFYSILRLGGDHKADKKLLLKEVESECSDAFMVPLNAKVEVMSTNPSVSMPTGLVELMSYDGNMEQFIIVKRGTKKAPEGAPSAQARNRFVRYSGRRFGVNHRFSSLNSVVTLATSLNSHDNVVRNLGYSELSTRINKQLRIGFVGIPTKMFVYSLFYCGRIKPDFRVRRVALSISSINKFMPPPHLLYGRMFDTEISLVLNKPRPMPYDKQRSKSSESQDTFTNELVQTYSNEVNSYLKTKADETNLPTVLSMFAQVSLAKGNLTNQSCFSNKKIPIVASGFSSSANTSNSSSTPTDRKKTMANSFESTPRQKTRQGAELTIPLENLQSFRPRQDAVLRRHVQHPHGIMSLHQYQQMQMMYNMMNAMQQQMKQMNNINMMNLSQQMNAMNNINAGMGNLGNMNMAAGINMAMGQPINSIGSMNQQLSSMGQQINAMNQGMGGMSQQLVYNIQNQPMQHYQEEESYQYRYDQQRPRHS